MDSKLFTAACWIFIIFISEVVCKQWYLVETEGNNPVKKSRRKYRNKDTEKRYRDEDDSRCSLKRKGNLDYKYLDDGYSIGKSLRGKNLEKFASKNPRDCQKNCKKDPECTHWSFIKTFFETNENISNKKSKCFPYGGHCSLKKDDKKKKTRKNPNAISGPKDCKPPRN